MDDISFRWQELQSPNDLSDAPSVLIRDGLNSTIPESRSPDIILCFKDAIPGSNEPEFDGQSFGEGAFGGENWDADFSSGEPATDELHTMMVERGIRANGESFTIPYLDHREFCYFLRLENLSAESQDVTVRIFLAAKGVAEDRRMWMEMDKFRRTLRPSRREVIYRPAELSSVIQKPAAKPPKPISKPGSDADDNYCNCGWPYNLLLPRGMREGMAFRLMVMVTDWEKDHVGQDASCGSMSFCGARDRYPDTRGMGYPFDRRFSEDRSIETVIAEQDNMAARDVTIRWVYGWPKTKRSPRAVPWFRGVVRTFAKCRRNRVSRVGQRSAMRFKASGSNADG